MTVAVRIPLILTSLTNGQAEVHIRASSVREMVDSLEEAFPGMKTRLCDGRGELRDMLNFFVNNMDIRLMDGVDTKLQEDDRVSILPLIAGG